MRNVNLFVTALLLLASLSLHAQPGTLDIYFNPETGTDNSLHTIAWQPVGKITIEGYLTGCNGTNRDYTARVNGGVSDYTSWATTSSNYGSQSVTQSPAAGTTVSGAGNMTVTLTVTDASNLTNMNSMFYFAGNLPRQGDEFIITIKTDNAGTSNGTSFTIPTSGSGYNYQVDWNDDGLYEQSGLTGNATWDYGTAGTYTIRIRGDFPRIFFNADGDCLKLTGVEQWGSIAWSSMENAFYGCENLASYTATDAPDLSEVTSMAGMFRSCTQFNGAIDNWNVGNVTDMAYMFYYAFFFNQPIGNWNVGNVTTMNRMFAFAFAFNQPIGNWNVGNVTDMRRMFESAGVFNQPIGNWNVGNVTTMESMFAGTDSFNQPIGNWDVGKVTEMNRMFAFADSFNQPICNWNVSNVTDMANMFNSAGVFNQQIGNWNVGNVTDMNGMFNSADAFNQPIGNWNVGNVTDMHRMFESAGVFNQPIGNWNVGNVTTMAYMFYSADAFNQPIGNWNVGNVTTMYRMFNSADSFNQPIGNWSVGNVTDMANMFYSADAFNQPIGNWNVGNVTTMAYMFYSTDAFNQPIGNWNVGNVTTMNRMFAFADSFNQPIGNWNVGNVTDMANMFYSADAFNQPIGNWNVGNVTTMSHMFTHVVAFNQPIGNWNVGNVTDMASMFYSAEAFNQPIGNWNVGNVTNMKHMFAYTIAFNQPIGNWNVGNVTIMQSMFAGTEAFNQPIGNWNVGNVTDMNGMFYSASAFNQPIGNWNVGNVTTMSDMFTYTIAFNQPIGNWNVGNVTDMNGMFYSAVAFNQPIGNWMLNSDVEMNTMLSYSGMDCASYSATLTGWVGNPGTPNNRYLGAEGLQYGTNAVAARDALLAKGWTIYGDAAGGSACSLPCPDLSTAPLELNLTNSACVSNCTPSGGSISVPPSTTCPTGSTLQYSTDNGVTWTTMLPSYNQTTPMRVLTRCICDSDGITVSPTGSVTTAPGECTPPAAPVIENSNGLVLDCNNPSTVLSVAAPSNNTWALDGNPAGSGPSINAVVAGTYQVMNTAPNGCTSSSTVSVTFTPDNTPPSITCFNKTVTFNGEQSIALDPAALVSATDACGIKSIALSPNSINAERVGQTVPVTVTVTDVNDNPSTCTSNITVAGLPAGWSQQPGGVGCDDGNEISFNPATGVWTATSTNCYYASPYAADETAFAQRTLCGDGSITAQVTSITGSVLGWAGVVMRESNAPGSKKAQLMTNLSNFSRREFRTTTNGQAIPQQFPSQNRYWLRIVRTGNQFALYVSPNGTAWYIAGVQQIVMTNCIQMGLVVSNYTSNSTATATFSGVSYTGSNATAATMQGVARAASLESPYSFEVYPNPTSGELNVDLTAYAGKAIRLEVYSIEGKLMQFREIDEVQANLVQLDFSNYLSGMYLVRVKSDGLPDVTRRVVMR